MVEPILRRANKEDSQRLAELITQLGYPASTDEVRSRFELIDHDDEHALFVAELDGKVAGWVHIFIYKLLEADRLGELGGLIVEAAQRGRGLGRRLMEQAEKWAREQGCSAVYLRSNVIRKEAHEFYGAIGYELFKTQHAFRKSLK
jgi:N-acetylglutamate synthase-like GNAT family acetyltransferase